MNKNSLTAQFHILRFLTILCLLMVGLGNARAQPQAPELLCADVQADGSVILTWNTPPNVSVGANYQIFRDMGDGNGFQLINTVGPETATSYQDGLVDASVGSVGYRLRTISGGTSEQGNMVYTLFLNLSSSNLSSVADLTWNNPFPSPPGQGQFVIYRNIDGNGYSAIASVDASITTFRDTLDGLCSVDPVPINYKVSFQRDECEMFSQETFNEFQDLLGPEAVEVETVLINPFTGLAEIYWYPSQALDLDEYLIQSVVFQSGNTVYLNAGYVQEGQPANFEYNEPNTDQPTNLVVIAFDSCGNDQSFSEIYSTIYAGSKYKDCAQAAEISWSPYTGWDEGVESYEIHSIVDGGADQVVATVGEEIRDYDLPVDPNKEYCVYIEAISNGEQRASTSNMTCIQTSYPEVIDFNYLSRVTTVDENQIQIDLYQDSGGEETTYELMRSEEGDDFESLGIYNATQTPLLTVFDTDVNTTNSVYTYKWKAYDGCGEELPESNIGKNILLSETPGSDDLVNRIEWNGYASWDGGVMGYDIYRKLGNEASFSLYQTVGSDQFSFEEDIEEFIQDEGEFCYKIVANEGPNQYGIKAFSESNVVCITQEPFMWIPNTIVINGHNPIFKPVAGFIEFESYRMEIYNKWGQKVFASDNIEDGWDGKVDGHPVREDYFRYVIAYRDGSGKPFVEQGVLYVLKDS